MKIKLAIVDNAHVIKTSSGEYYSKTVYSYDFFKRYLDSFDSVRFITKVKVLKHDDIDFKSYMRVDGPKVEIFELPWYQGIKGLLKNILKIRKTVRNSLEGCDGYLLRLAQVECYLFDLFAKKNKKKYIVELVNDPNLFMDMNYLFRRINVIYTRKIIKKAIGVSYVTKDYLQSKYPSLAHKTNFKKGFTNYYSTIDLYDDQILSVKTDFFEQDIFRIVHVSNSIESDIKGHSTVIKVANNLKQLNIPFKVTFIGSGTKVPHYKALIQKLNLANEVEFYGTIVHKNELLTKLRENDLLLLPTRLEGLPRVIIESMAVGLPSISTPIAGIPELLDKEFMYKYNDYNGITNKIVELYSNKDKMVQISKKNIEKVKEYEYSKLILRRKSFYKNFRDYLEKQRIEN